MTSRFTTSYSSVIAWRERRNGDVFFFVVGVDRGVARDRRASFLCGVGSGGDDGAVRFVNAHGAKFDLFVRGVVAENKFAQLLHAGVALHADAHGEIEFAGAVIFESHGGEILLDDERFLRKVRRQIAERGGGCVRDLAAPVALAEVGVRLS